MAWFALALTIALCGPRLLAALVSLRDLRPVFWRFRITDAAIAAIGVVNKIMVQAAVVSYPACFVHVQNCIGLDTDDD